MAKKSLKKKVYQFTAIFEKNENGGYTVTVPSLPGLVTEGKDLEEAKKMVEDAIRCYLEGLKKENKKIPEEKEIGQFRIEVKI
jgi:antitoxin HicB